ncbi:MAG TPA: dTDP-4-dehydrorhamnose reductase [Verrucomicrobiae bacterium]|nr:dTDP-4-dehydrorhamnose reductase [Verrucomicrobiae bacterium]
MKRVLLIGGSGQLGTEIRRHWSDCEIAAPSRDALEFEDTIGLAEALDERRPEVVVNCTAFHNVDRCEDVPNRAFEVNALSVDRAARLCHDRNVVFVTISTDYVFDGTASRPYVESDAPHPINAYGASKLAGELLVERLHSRAFVVRTCGLYGEHASEGKGYTFVDRILAQARAGQPVRVVRDVMASPTFAGDLAVALRALVETEAFGTYHLANAGPVSWYDFAREALRRAGVAWEIEPIRAAEWKGGARRPAYSALASERLGALGIEMPAWDQGIAHYLRLKSGN